MHLAFPGGRGRCILARRQISIIVAVHGFVGVACSGGDSEVPLRSEEALQITEMPFSAALELIESFELEQDDEFPIVRLSGLSVAPDGRIAIGDGSEGNVRIHDAAGRLLTVLGRRGAGPGEFQIPQFPRFDQTGRLFVADRGLNRVSVFDRAGVFEKTIALDVRVLNGFQLWSNGQFVVFDRLAPLAIHVIDSTGQTVDSFFERPPGHVPVANATNPMWQTLLGYYLAVRGDSAFVTATVSDSLWIIDLVSGSATSRRMRFPGYQEPTLPTDEFAFAEVPEFVKRFHLTAFLGISEARFAVAFTKGVLHYGNPTTVIVQRPQTGWVALSNAPPPLYLDGDRLLVLANPSNIDSLVVAWYRFH